MACTEDRWSDHASLHTAGSRENKWSWNWVRATCSHTWFMTLELLHKLNLNGPQLVGLIHLPHVWKIYTKSTYGIWWRIHWSVETNISRNCCSPEYSWWSAISHRTSSCRDTWAATSWRRPSGPASPHPPDERKETWQTNEIRLFCNTAFLSTRQNLNVYKTGVCESHLTWHDWAAKIRTKLYNQCR